MEAIVDSIAGGLAGYGVLGFWALYLIWTISQKDKIIEQRNNRIDDLISRSLDREIETTKTLSELTFLVRAISGGR